MRVPWGWLPVVGDLLAFADDRIAFFADCARRGDVVRVRLGPKHAVVLSDPEHLRTLFVREADHFVRGVTGLPFRPIVGEGLLLSEGETWRRQRRTVQPLFSAEKTHAWADIAATAAQHLLGRWSEGDRKDLDQEMRRLSLDIAATVVLGVASRADGAMHPALEDLLDAHLFGAGPQIPAVQRLTGRRAREALRGLDEVIAESAAADEPPGLMGPLIRGSYDARELRDQAVTLLFTALDTTSVALTWTSYLLAANSDARAKVLMESREGARPNERAGPYLMAVINESLRLYPPVLGQGREAIRDCEIGGVALPTGTLVLFSQWTIHRDARWFDRADEFVPERWLDGLEDRIHPFAYFPFGAGRRNCVGRQLAVAILAAVVPMLAGTCRLELEDMRAPAVTALLSPRPRYGLAVTVRGTQGVATARQN